MARSGTSPLFSNRLGEADMIVKPQQQQQDAQELCSARAGAVYPAAPTAEIHAEQLKCLKPTDVIEVQLPDGQWLPAMFVKADQKQLWLLFEGDFSFRVVPYASLHKYMYRWSMSWDKQTGSWGRRMLQREDLMMKVYMLSGAPRSQYKRIKAFFDDGSKGGTVCEVHCSNPSVAHWNVVVTASSSFGHFKTQVEAARAVDKFMKVMHNDAALPGLNWDDATFEQVIGEQFDLVEAAIDREVQQAWEGFVKIKKAGKESTAVSKQSCQPLPGAAGPVRHSTKEQRLSPYTASRPTASIIATTKHTSNASAQLKLAEQMQDLLQQMQTAVRHFQQHGVEQQTKLVQRKEQLSTEQQSTKQQSTEQQINVQQINKQQDASATMIPPVPPPPATSDQQQSAPNVTAAYANSSIARHYKKVCRTFDAGSQISVLGQTYENGTFSRNGKVHRFTVLRPVGAGGNAELYLLQVNPSTNSSSSSNPELHKSSISTQLQISSPAADAQHITAVSLAPAGSASSASSHLSAMPARVVIKVPRSYDTLPDQLKQQVSQQEWHINAAAVLRHECQVLMQMADSAKVVKCLGYGIVQCGLQLLPCLLLEEGVYSLDLVLEQGKQAARAGASQATSEQDKIPKTEGLGLPADEVRCIIERVLRAMTDLSSKGVAWLDCKTSNVIYVNREEKLVPVVCDFGSAILVSDDALAAVHAPVGTKYCMAPEVRFDKQVGVKSDIWGLGCLMMFLRTGVALDVFEGLEAQPELFDTDSALLSWQAKGAVHGFKGLETVELDFVKQCFVYDYGKRKTALSLLVSAKSRNYLQCKKKLGPAGRVEDGWMALLQQSSLVM